MIEKLESLDDREYSDELDFHYWSQKVRNNILHNLLMATKLKQLSCRFVIIIAFSHAVLMPILV